MREQPQEFIEVCLQVHTNFYVFCLLVYLHIFLETEELKQKIRLLQLELEDALEVAEVSESESGK